MARRMYKSEAEMVKHIVEGARKGGKASQAKRTPAERARIGKKGGAVIKKAFEHFKRKEETKVVS